MPSCTVFDLHCDTLTAFMDPIRCPDTLNDPASRLCPVPDPHGVLLVPVLRRIYPRRPDGGGGLGVLPLPPGPLFPPDGAVFRLCPPLPHRGGRGAGLGRGKNRPHPYGGKRFLPGRQSGPAEELRRDGVRIASLTWNGPNALGSGHQTGAGLSSLGREAVGVLEDCGIFLDVSHLNDAGLRDVLDAARRPLSGHPLPTPGRYAPTLGTSPTSS